VKKSSIVGIATTTEAAMMEFWAEEYWFWKLAMPVCTTHKSGLLVIVSGQRKEFQLARKEKTASAVRIGCPETRPTMAT
jgi:hypothetical protein